MSARAELIADRGAAASAAEFFRCKQFLRAEDATHSLLVEGEGSRLALPVLVREIPGSTALDALSPYGYPGGSLSGAPLAPEAIDWSATGLVSLFVRERVGAPSLAGGTQRSQLQVHDPALPRSVRDTLGSEVRRNERDGFSVALLPGPELDEPTVAAFNQAYDETMRRAGAAERYFFGIEYLIACLEFERSWLAVVRAPAGELAAAAIAAVSDGVLHYYLAGTADAHRQASPGKNALLRLLGLADELGIVLNLGGGVQPGDGLEAFKRGFANATRPFMTHEIVCDARAYAELAEGREAGGYFPAYRAAA